MPGFQDDSLPEVGMVSKDGWIIIIDLVTSLEAMFCHGTRESAQLFKLLFGVLLNEEVGYKKALLRAS